MSRTHPMAPVSQGRKLMQTLFMLMLTLICGSCSSSIDRQVLHHSVLGDYQVEILRRPHPGSADTLHYVVKKDGKVVQKERYLGEYKDSYSFSSVIHRKTGIVTVSLATEPEKIVLAFDTKTGQGWPGVTPASEEDEKLKQAILDKLNQIPGKRKIEARILDRMQAAG